MYSFQEIPISLVNIPSDLYNLWNLSFKNGKVFGNYLYQYYQKFDPDIFDINNTEKYIESNGPQEYYYKVEKLLHLYKEWYKDRCWKSPIVLEKIKHNYLVHLGADRFSILKYDNIKSYNFMIIEDRSIFDNRFFEEIKKYWQDDVRKTLIIKDHPYDGKKILFADSLKYKNFSRRDEIKKWLASGKAFSQYVLEN